MDETNSKKDQRTDMGIGLLPMTTYLTIGENFSPCSVMVVFPAMVLGSAFDVEIAQFHGVCFILQVNRMPVYQGDD
jgi:hypothetical protein